MDQNIRIGFGHDTHRLEPGGPLRIGGIDIDFGFHLAGHSDADVLLHAITDAILGAARDDHGKEFAVRGMQEETSVTTDPSAIGGDIPPGLGMGMDEGGDRGGPRGRGRRPEPAEKHE